MVSFILRSRGREFNELWKLGPDRKNVENHNREK
jgi:hypothetical protein